jgi:hypothetical protein
MSASISSRALFQKCTDHSADLGKKRCTRRLFLQCRSNDRCNAITSSVSNAGFVVKCCGGTCTASTASRLQIIAPGGTCRPIIRSPHPAIASVVRRWRSNSALAIIGRAQQIRACCLRYRNVEGADQSVRRNLSGGDDGARSEAAAPQAANRGGSKLAGEDNAPGTAARDDLAVVVPHCLRVRDGCRLRARCSPLRKDRPAALCAGSRRARCLGQ